MPLHPGRDADHERTSDWIFGLANHPSMGSFEEKIQAFRGGSIRDALAASGDNRAQATRLLGLTYHRFRYYRRRDAQRQ